MFDADVQRSD